jgi:hypothetical protein
MHRERADHRDRCRREGVQEDAPDDPAIPLGHEAPGQRVGQPALDHADRELDRGLLRRDIVGRGNGTVRREADPPAGLGIVRPDRSDRDTGPAPSRAPLRFAPGCALKL